MLMPLTCASPLRSVAIGAGVGGKVSHRSAANAGSAVRTRRDTDRSARMTCSVGCVAAGRFPIFGCNASRHTLSSLIDCALGNVRFAPNSGRYGGAQGGLKPASGLHLG